MVTRPYGYQREGAALIEKFEGRALLADEMGLGKSLEALLWAHRNPEARPAVVVCPASLKWVWEREAKHHFGMRAEVLGGMKPPKKGILSPHGLYVINYTILGPWLSFLKGIAPQLVIVDECQALAHRHTYQSKNTRELCAGVPHVIALSGTPLTNRPSELWPVLNLLRPKLFPSFWSYAQQWCQPVLKPWGWDFNGAKDLDLLHHTLRQNLMVRRTKNQVLKDLPAKRRTVVPVGIDNPKEYQTALKDFLTWLAKQDRAKALKASRAEALVKVGYLKRLAADLKLQRVCEWVDTFLEGSEEKLVVFAVHKKVIAHLGERYKGLHVTIDGTTPPKHRRGLVDAFQGNKKIRLFIGNVKAAGVGLTLTAASTVLFAELPWTPGEVSQAEDRCHRIGTRSAVGVYTLVGKNTVEERICRILQEKQKVLDQVLDGGAGGGGLNVFDQLLAEMLKEGGGK